MPGEKSVNLEELVGETVIADLKGKRKIQGTLDKYDDYMNLVLKRVKEFEGEELVKEHDIIVIKGGNVQTISLD